MQLIPWRDIHPLTVLQSDMDSILGQFLDWHKIFPWEGDGFRSLAVDLEETDKAFIVKAEIPGLDPKDFQISLAGNALTIKGEKKEEKKEENKNYHMIERHYGSFYRSIQLPSKVEGDKAEANYAKGILEIILPKSHPDKEKKISINVK